jgi:hypothetical protein
MRLGMNIFENALFSWSIAQRMVIRERAKVVLFGLIWIVVALLKSSADLTVVITQIIFATSVLSDYASLEFARMRFKRIYDDSWAFFQNGKPRLSKNNIAIITNRARNYDSIISSMRISLDSKIFNELNSTLSAKWEEIKQRLQL